MNENLKINPTLMDKLSVSCSISKYAPRQLFKKALNKLIHKNSVRAKKSYKLWSPFLGLWCFWSKQELILHATVFMNIKESPDLDMGKKNIWKISICRKIYLDQEVL